MLYADIAVKLAMYNLIAKSEKLIFVVSKKSNAHPF